MSGPKGMSYTVVETAEQRARRELAAARSQLRSALATAEELQVKLHALGLTSPVPVTSEPSTLEECRSAVASTEELCADMQHRIAAAISQQARLLADQTLADALSDDVPTGTLDLSRHGETRRTPHGVWVRSGGQGHSQVTDEGGPPVGSGSASGGPPRCAREDPAILAQVRRALDRLEVPEESIRELATEVLDAPVASASLLAVRLSSAVDHLNEQFHESARQERLHRRAVAEAAEQAEIRASDQRFVLDQVVDSLQELGYSVAGTSVVEPDQLLLSGGDVDGYGVAAGVSADEEILLRPVRTDPGVPPHDELAEEALCSNLLDLKEALARRGVGVGRVRSMPVGIVAVPLEPVVSRSGRAPARGVEHQGVLRDNRSRSRAPRRTSDASREG